MNGYKPIFKKAYILSRTKPVLACENSKDQK